MSPSRVWNWCRVVLMLSGAHLLLSMCTGLILLMLMPGWGEPSAPALEVLALSVGAVFWLATKVLDDVYVGTLIFYMAVVVNAFAYGLLYTAFYAVIMLLNRKRPPGVCGNCGYNRTGLPADRACPECGKAITRRTVERA